MSRPLGALPLERCCIADSWHIANLPDPLPSPAIHCHPSRSSAVYSEYSRPTCRLCHSAVDDAGEWTDSLPAATLQLHDMRLPFLPHRSTRSQLHSHPPLPLPCSAPPQHHLPLQRLADRCAGERRLQPQLCCRLAHSRADAKHTAPCPPPFQIHNRDDGFQWKGRATAFLLQHWFLGRLVQQERVPEVSAVYNFAIEQGGWARVVSAPLRPEPASGASAWPLGAAASALMGAAPLAQVAPACPRCCSQTPSPRTPTPRVGSASWFRATRSGCTGLWRFTPPPLLAADQDTCQVLLVRNTSVVCEMLQLLEVQLFDMAGMQVRSGSCCSAPCGQVVCGQDAAQGLGS